MLHNLFVESGSADVLWRSSRNYKCTNVLLNLDVQKSYRRDTLIFAAEQPLPVTLRAVSVIIMGKFVNVPPSQRISRYAYGKLFPQVRTSHTYIHTPTPEHV